MTIFLSRGDALLGNKNISGLDPNTQRFIEIIKTKIKPELETRFGFKEKETANQNYETCKWSERKNGKIYIVPITIDFFADFPKFLDYDFMVSSLRPQDLKRRTIDEYRAFMITFLNTTYEEVNPAIDHGAFKGWVKLTSVISYYTDNELVYLVKFETKPA